MRNTFRSITAALTETPEGCLIWTGALSNTGYGTVSFKSRTSAVHRLLFEQCFGSIPEAHDIHHLCGRRECANPFHLQAVADRDHALLDGHLAARITARGICPRGHPLQPAPDCIRRGNGSKRYCPICTQARVKRYRAGVALGKGVVHRSHCKKDHPLSGENLYVAPNGLHYCRTCRADVKRERKLRHPGPGRPLSTHCLYGHPMEGDNLRIHAGGDRICMECQRQRSRKHKERQKAKRALEASAESAPQPPRQVSAETRARLSAAGMRKNCIRGHPIETLPSGARLCRICRSATAAKTRQRRKDRYPRTHCIKGHELTVENTWVKSDGRRQCKICLIYGRRHGAQPRR